MYTYSYITYDIIYITTYSIYNPNMCILYAMCTYVHILYIV